MNIDRFNEVLAKIDLHPDEFSQITWHSDCGTKHCFGGWAQILAGCKQDPLTARNDARKFLRLTYAEADYIFSYVRTREELRAIPGNGVPIFDKSGLFPERERFDSAGYDPAGYDSASFAGYDSAGYDSAGFNREGLDRDGLGKFT